VIAKILKEFRYDDAYFRIVVNDHQLYLVRPRRPWRVALPIRRAAQSRFPVQEKPPFPPSVHYAPQLAGQPFALSYFITIVRRQQNMMLIVPRQ
jgi:hypothetical protein